MEPYGLWTLEVLITSHYNQKSNKLGLIFLADNWQQILTLGEKIYTKRQHKVNNNSDAFRSLSIGDTHSILKFFIQQSNANLVKSFEEEQESYVLNAYNRFVDTIFLIRGS